MPRTATSRKTKKPTRITRPKDRRCWAPRSKPATGSAQPAGALAPLVWITGSPAHRTAAVPRGTYLVLTHDSCVTWSAEWRPTNGTVQRLAFRQPRSEAEQACEYHRKLVDANDRLIAGGHEELVGDDITGEAVAWKKGRR